MKKKFDFFVLPVIAVFILFPAACSDSSQTEDSKSIHSTDQSRPEVSQKNDEGRLKEAGSSIKGGREVKMHPFTLVMPGDWKRHQRFDIWCPATEADSNSMPDHYLTQGARPPTMLKSSDLIEGIKMSIGGADPQGLKMIKIGAMSGATCGWEKGKYKSVGLFLQEKNPMFDIPLLNFFILRAPKDSFPQYEDTYKAILKSVRI